jgi:hypothetical protein
MLNRLLSTLFDLRHELTPYIDVIDGANGPLPNEAMRLAREIDVELGLCSYEAPSHKCVILNGLIDDSLDFLNHAIEVKFGYRSA